MNDDFQPTASLENLRKRAEVIRSVRSFFEERRFVEVETPILSHDIVVDRYLHPMGISKAEVTGSDGDSDRKLWLQTSPEFGMKRLVAAGATAIFQIGKCFRQSESGSRHNPEFTMLEWYRIDDDLQRGMELLAELVECLLDKPKTQTICYRDVFTEYAGVDPFSCSVSELKSVAETAISEIEMQDDEQSRDDWLNLILSCVIEPKLGKESATIVYDWPASQAALAKVRQEEHPVAERFELFVDGIELANGYHELLDAEELIRRNSIANQQRVKDGAPLLPEGSRLLSAMRNGLPACAGVALGVDRLVMLAIGAETIADVIAFPIDRA